MKLINRKQLELDPWWFLDIESPISAVEETPFNFTITYKKETK